LKDPAKINFKNLPNRDALNFDFFKLANPDEPIKILSEEEQVTLQRKVTAQLSTKSLLGSKTPTRGATELRRTES